MGTLPSRRTAERSRMPRLLSLSIPGILICGQRHSLTLPTNWRKNSLKSAAFAVSMNTLLERPRRADHPVAAARGMTRVTGRDQTT